MALYKYVKTDILKKILGGNVRFTQPGAFNDPFELLPELHSPDATDQVLNIAFDLQASRRMEPVGKLQNDFRSEFCSDVNSRKILNLLNKSIGILCLSQKYNSLLMWSHYADEYKGAIISFDDEHEFFKGLIEVEYSTHRPKFDMCAYTSDIHPIPIAELCVKPKEWEYEEEIRIIRNLSACKIIASSDKHPVYIMDIPTECIKAITMGERTPVEEQRKIFDMVKNTNISLFLAAISNWNYQFRDEIIKYDAPVHESPPVISPRTAHIFSEWQNELGEAARWMLKNHKYSEIVNDTL